MRPCFRRSFVPSYGLGLKSTRPICCGIGADPRPVAIRFATSSHGNPRRLSAEWVPSGGIAVSRDEGAHEKLVRAGFLRQSYAGVFHMLPLGRRVQDKIEGLLDHHMQRLGASRVSLSSITSRDLWERSGRYSLLGPELFNFQDRRGKGYMLSPTHEEEITSLVAKSIKSYKELPLRLYQISAYGLMSAWYHGVGWSYLRSPARKYRDELRPRHGLLRTREFTMKDMYTFDATVESALETYTEVQRAYTSFFTSLGLPFVRAQASSGDMGGDLSHEYHLLTPVGEDTITSCSVCDHAMNAEISGEAPSSDQSETSGQGQARRHPDKSCPKCTDGVLTSAKALEVGHTFHLGTRYSSPLGATVASPSGTTVPLQMGCHGIGVSRLIGAIAEHLTDSKGLQWPRVVAPYEVAVLHTTDLDPEAVELYSSILRSRQAEPVDVILDDRNLSIPWKLKDADLVGYPVVVVMGKAMKETGTCEIQCRRLGVADQIPCQDVAAKVADLLQKV